MIEQNHIILNRNPFGIKAKNTEVSIVKVAIECPEGRLVLPERTFPIIRKLSLSNTAAGLGIANSVFNKNEIIPETSRELNKACHNLGA